MFCGKNLGRICKICLGWVNVKTKMRERPVVEIFVRHLAANFGESVIRVTSTIS